jgi:hypothetical protein
LLTAGELEKYYERVRDSNASGWLLWACLLAMALTHVLHVLGRSSGWAALWDVPQAVQGVGQNSSARSAEDSRPQQVWVQYRKVTLDEISFFPIYQPLFITSLSVWPAAGNVFQMGHACYHCQCLLLAHPQLSQYVTTST